MHRPAEDNHKQALYFTKEIMEELQAEAIRLDRSLSWLLRVAWRFSRERLREFPSADLMFQPRIARAPERRTGT